MNRKPYTDLHEPDIVEHDAILLAGLSKKYAAGNNSAIPSQWQAFAPLIGSIAGQIGSTTYGVIYNMDDEDNHEYMCAVEVKNFDGLPEDMARLRLPKQTYAVFMHDRHVSEIQATCRAIWSDWLPGSGREPADSPFFERYTGSFDPKTGDGGLEVWLPLK